MTERFPWLSLDDDEEIVWSGQPRVRVVLWVAVPALAIPVILALAWSPLPGAAVGVLAWAGITALGHLYVTNVEYAVSTKYVYSKTGILGWSVTQVGLHNIQDTTLSQGIFGTRSGYGTVSFSTAGGEGTTLAFYLVDDPEAVTSAVDSQIARAGKRSNGKPDRSDSRGVKELLSELRATRDVAQRIDTRLKNEGEQP